jgi:hypothetical protein
MCLNDPVKEDALFAFVIEAFFGVLVVVTMIACVAELV